MRPILRRTDGDLAGVRVGDNGPLAAGEFPRLVTLLQAVDKITAAVVGQGLRGFEVGKAIEFIGWEKDPSPVPR